jgi:hypothetical protein
VKLANSVSKIVSVVGLVGISSLGLSFLAIQKSALAQSCNVFGCSQPGAGECNVFGCPNPGAGSCEVFGCPSAPVNTNPTPPPANSNQSPSNGSNNSSNRTFTVRNNTNQSVQSLYLSRSSESSWGNSDIGSTLFNGNSVNFTLTGACNWDLRVELANGQSLEQMGIDTCLNNSYSLGNTSGDTSTQKQPQQQSTNQGNTQPQANPPASSSTSSASPARSDTELYLTFYNECMDRTMYRTLRSINRATALNGFESGYSYGRKPSDLSDEQMQSLGLRWEWSYDAWIGSQPEVKMPIREMDEASQICTNELSNVRQ